MKLFALHGHLQSAKRFRGQTNAIARHLKKAGVELVFVDGPHILPDSPEGSPFRTWVDGDSLEESYKAIEMAHNENPDVVGFFAFSMGSMLALHLAAHAATIENSPFKWIKIIISASAPYPKDDSPLQRCFPCQCHVPVLFVSGIIDEIAPLDSQRRYLEYFPNRSVFEHDGGHYIPSSKDKIQPFIDFVLEQKKNIE